MKNLKLHWHRLLNSKTININGLVICTDKSKMPRSVRSALFKGTHEKYERQLVEKYVSFDDRVLEIGAATGFISAVCAMRCGIENVLSYEANPAMEKLIRKNFSLNGWQPNLTMKAVTVEGEEIDFFAAENVISSSGITERSNSLPGEVIKVPSDPLGRIISEFKPTVIVMDVEGAEIELLGIEDLGDVTKIIVEFHPHITPQKSIDQLLEKLAGSDFKVVTQAHKTAFLEKGKNS